MKLRILALGQDEFWLTAVQTASLKAAGSVTIYHCQGPFADCLASLPPADPGTVVLLDAWSRADLVAFVTEFKARGWRYVVVVAADPTAKEAAAVLRHGLAYDYWEKTYEEAEIRRRIQVCFKEIAEARTASGSQNASFE